MSYLLNFSKSPTKWAKGSVIAPNDRPRSYNVLNEKGNSIIRNRRHLIPTNEILIDKHDYDNIIESSEAASQKPLYKQKLTYLQILPHHQLEQNPDVLLRNQRGIWRNVE